MRTVSNILKEAYEVGHGLWSWTGLAPPCCKWCNLEQLPLFESCFHTWKGRLRTHPCQVAWDLKRGNTEALGHCGSCRNVSSRHSHCYGRLMFIMTLWNTQVFSWQRSVLLYFWFQLRCFMVGGREHSSLIGAWDKRMWRSVVPWLAFLQRNWTYRSPVFLPLSSQREALSCRVLLASLLASVSPCCLRFTACCCEVGLPLWPFGPSQDQTWSREWTVPWCWCWSWTHFF